MTKYARVVDDVAVEIFVPPQGVSIDEFFHPDISSKFVVVPDDVTAGSTKKNSTWTINVPVPQVENVVYQVVGPIHFQMLFTPLEAVKLQELRETDKILARFWKLVDDPRTNEINLGLKSVQDEIEYTLNAVKTAGLAVDVAARKTEILTGVLL